MDTSRLKKIVAIEAVKYIESGMVLGLGTGSTVNFALHEISKLLINGTVIDIVGIPSSKQTAKLASDLGIKIIGFRDIREIDLNIDGADEADYKLNLIKGGGGALLKEKIIAQASNKNIILVDEGKMSESLGSKWPVPVEVIEFAYEPVLKYLKFLGGAPNLRTINDREPFRTDEGNLIIDCNFGEIDDVYRLSRDLSAKAGIVEHGLFIDIADEIVIGKPDGIKILKK